MPSYDITDLVNKLSDSFQRFGVEVAYHYIVSLPHLAWLATPGLDFLLKSLLKLAFFGLTESGIMGAYFHNTAVNKINDANDYIVSVREREFLNSVGTKEEFRNAELKEIANFKQLVMVTR